MESFSHFFKSSVPNYFNGLPLPNTVGGFFSLSGKFLFYFNNNYFYRLKNLIKNELKEKNGCN
jgi:hypothetical protein